MTSNDNKKPNMSGGIRMALERLLLRRVQQPDKPYIPQPDQDQNDFLSDLGTDDHCEIEADINQVSGMQVTFGTKKIIQIGKTGQDKDISQGISHRIGSNKIISKIEEIEGVCPICEVSALAEYQAGRIALQQAQLASMYDKDSAAKCDLCHRNICAAHCRPIQIDDAVQNICANCLQKLEIQKRKRQILNFLLAPFIKTEEQR